MGYMSTGRQDNISPVLNQPQSTAGVIFKANNLHFDVRDRLTHYTRHS